MENNSKCICTEIVILFRWPFFGFGFGFGFGFSSTPLTLTACDVAKASGRQADKERKPV
ncbi:MAG: hypothetical protein Q7T66_12350 [Herminiimonas sp.]|uniref:hypothetical protein n=1 Tax=Herminiimonas sp. TaxID=1926289 RepID=UPI0027256806|nr:hypothetical protein [Herminiimonas sp.]MDO9421441.1 hypothetical protein [Herminiimonas sp.]